jgi:hypothetical protein
MAIPSFVIVLPFLASFLMCAVRYYHEDATVRPTHPAFLVGASAVLLTIIYVMLMAIAGAILWVSLLFMVLAFASLALGVRLLRRKPPSPAPDGG